MRFITLLLLLLPSLVIAKPSMGIIEFEIQSKDLKQNAVSLYTHLRTQTVKNLDKKYKILPKPTMGLQDMYMMLGCMEPNTTCMQSIAKMLKADHLLYGQINRVNTNNKLTLFLLNTKTGHIKKGELLSPAKKLDHMYQNIDTALRKMFNLALPVEYVLQVSALDHRNKSLPGMLYIDGKPSGKLPVMFKQKDLSAGNHELLIKQDGFNDVRQTVIITPTETIKAVITMKPYIAAAQKNPRQLDLNKTQTLTNNNNQETPLYKEWWFWGTIGGVVLTTVVTIVLINSGDDGGSTTPRNNLIISF